MYVRIHIAYYIMRVYTIDIDIDIISMYIYIYIHTCEVVPYHIILPFVVFLMPWLIHHQLCHQKTTPCKRSISSRSNKPWRAVVNRQPIGCIQMYTVVMYTYNSYIMLYIYIYQYISDFDESLSYIISDFDASLSRIKLRGASFAPKPAPAFIHLNGKRSKRIRCILQGCWETNQHPEDLHIWAPGTMAITSKYMYDNVTSSKKEQPRPRLNRHLSSHCSGYAGELWSGGILYTSSGYIQITNERKLCMNIDTRVGFKYADFLCSTLSE